MNKNVTINVLCRLCGSPELRTMLSLGQTPLADLFVKSPDAEEQHFPLDVAVCTNCWLVQLVDDVDSELLFGDNYAFYTGGSPSSLKYFEDYANDMMQRFPYESKRVLEIASNDGTLLDHFRKKHNKVLGIDPAKNVAAEANKNHIETWPEFFNSRTAQKIVADPCQGQFSLILANNVVAHVTDVHDLFEGVKTVMDGDGMFVFECQYFPYLLFNNQFDNVYHEHRSFFSLTPLYRALKAHGLKIFDVQEKDTQGGSIRVFVCHEQTDHEVSPVVQQMLTNEEEIGLKNLNTYLGFASRVQYIKIKLHQILSELKAQGKTVYGYGASAKSNTLLNYCGIGTNYLEYIVDKTPYKYGLYTPGTHVPVVEQGTVPDPDYYLLLVWNYATGIMKREQAYRDKGGKFIIPIPVPSIV